MKNTQAKAIKTDWQQIKHIVEKLNRPLFEIIDNISPKNLPIYEVEFPYGMMIGCDKVYYQPDEMGNLTEIPSYKLPYTFVVEKCLEVFINLNGNIIPWQVYKPGSFLPYNAEIETNLALSPRPKSIFTMTSGIRSLTVLPLYSRGDSFEKLAAKFNISKFCDPQNTTTHHQIVVDILKHHDNKWCSRVLMFGDEWKDKIQNDSKWQPLKIFLLQQSIIKNSFKRNAFYLDHAMMDIARKYKIRNKDFTHEKIKEMFLIAMGDIPGYKPSMDDSGLPLTDFIEIFDQYYHSSTTPIVVEAVMNDHLHNNYPVYQSLWIGDTTLSDRKTFRPLSYLAEMANSIDIYLSEFQNHLLTKSSGYGKLKNILDYTFYSERGSSNTNIVEAHNLIDNDKRFYALYKKYEKTSLYGFPSRSFFTKALIGMRLKLPASEYN